MTSKIYLFVNCAYPHLGALEAMAVSEDGVVLATHLSSNQTWAQHDLGITSGRQHDKYKRYYPNGYELEWVTDPSTHAGLVEAKRLHNLRQARKVELADREGCGL